MVITPGNPDAILYINGSALGLVFELAVMVFLIVSLILSNEDFWIRTAMSLRNTEESRATSAISILVMGIVSSIGVVLGANVRGGALGDAVANWFEIPQKIGELCSGLSSPELAAAILMITAASVTTLDTIKITIAQVFGASSSTRQSASSSDPRRPLAFIVTGVVIALQIIPEDDYMYPGVWVLSFTYATASVLMLAIFSKRPDKLRLWRTNIVAPALLTLGCCLIAGEQLLGNLFFVPSFFALFFFLFWPLRGGTGAR
jgi:hypothetical protein